GWTRFSAKRGQHVFTTVAYLRQIVAEGCHHHVLLGMRSATEAWIDVANDVGKLRSPLNSAFRSVIELVIEPGGVLEEALGIAGAVGGIARCESVAARRN